MTVTERPPLELASLQLTGGTGMYPAFDPAIRHYALTCDDSTALLAICPS